MADFDRAPIRQLLVFSSTPDVAADGFVVPLLTAEIGDLGWKARELGFDGLEFLPNPDEVPTAAQLRKATAESGTVVSVINSGRLRPKGYAVLHRDAVRRRESIVVFKRLIDLAGELGARVGLGMARGDSETTVQGDDLGSVMHDVFAELAEHAAACGTRVMLEPADPGYVAVILRVREAYEAARRIASPGFGIMLDTYQLDQVEESFDLGFKDAGGLADHIHLYDRRHWSPGIEASERMDWNAIRAAMMAHGFSGSGSTVPPKAGDIFTRTRASTAFLRAQLSDSAATTVPSQRSTAKRALVTGGGSGIGQAVAEDLAGRGYHVFVADLSYERANAVAASLGAIGGGGTALAMDVSDARSVAAGLALIDEELDALVCAAGIFVDGTAETTTLEQWQHVLDINLTGSFLAVKTSLPRLRRGSSIVLLSSSTGAHDALPNALAYVTSKGGVTMMTKALAADLAASGIRVNAIAPGPTDTPMLRGLLDEEGRRAFGDTLPVKRLGTPAEIAAAVAFLLDEKSSFVTGAIVPVDGGQTAVV